MSKLLMFDFECASCGHQFEDLVQPQENFSACPECHGEAIRQVSSPRLDWKLGIDPAFSTLGSKWAKMQWQKSKVDKGGRADGAPNLKMY
jgi:putative FmdB family regulatory protein